MDLSKLFKKASQFEMLSAEEGVFLFENAALADLMFVADELRKKQVPHGKVTWQIDRNVNTTNVCIASFVIFTAYPAMPMHILLILKLTKPK
jgi:cyclic dehypoxanthinyl futalosine synthase